MLHQSKEYKRAFRKKNQKWLDNYKLKKGCELCGWNEFVEALHVHHKVPIKRQNLQDRKSFLGKQYSIKKMKERLKDCIILCSRCHRLVHLE